MFIRNSLLSVAACCLSLASYSAAPVLSVNTTSINLTEDRTAGQIQVSVKELTGHNYQLRLQPLSGVRHTATDIIELKPVHAHLPEDSTVKLAINYPFTSATPGGEFQTDINANRIIPGKLQQAWSSYSPCLAQKGRSDLPEQSCKPLSVVVIDDQKAAPFVTYQGSFRIEVRQPGQPDSFVDKTITVTYKRCTAPVWLSFDHILGSRHASLYLNRQNHYTAEKGICVYSPFAWFLKGFEVKLEGSQSADGSTFQLSGDNGTVPYYAGLSFASTGDFHNYAPGSQWTGKGRMYMLCWKKNLRVQVKVLEKDVHATLKGIYTDTLTIRVRAL